jgi:hypothetical protein
MLQQVGPWLTYVSLALNVLTITFSIISVVRWLRDRKASAELRRALAETQEAISRQMYLIQIVNALETAQKSVFIVTQTMGSEQGDEVTERIFEIADRKQLPEFRCLAPYDEEKLDRIVAHAQHGMEVRCSRFPSYSRCRWTVVDNHVVVIGLAPAEREKSTKGFTLNNGFVAELLRKEFESLWEDAEPYEQFVMETCEEIQRRYPKMSCEAIAEQLSIDQVVLERIFEQCAELRSRES